MTAAQTPTVMPTVRNRDRLTDHGLRDLRMTVLEILEAGLAAADPGAGLQRILKLEGDELIFTDGRIYELTRYRRIVVMGAGKASLSMACAVRDMLASRLPLMAIVAVPTEQGGPCQGITVMRAQHPVPGRGSLRAAKALMSLADEVDERDLVLCCFSGGSSALLSHPPDGVSFKDKQALHRLLCASGARIWEMNAVRKHVSAVKGGRLALRIAPASIINLTVSDVAGGAHDLITDPTVQDTSTVADAVEVLHRYRLWDVIPQSVRAHMMNGKDAESPLVDGLDLHTITVVDGSTASQAMAVRAEQLGYQPLILPQTLEGDSRCVGSLLAQLAKGCYSEGRPLVPPCVLIGCGGESTVTVRQRQFGLGGPNQEVALAAALEMHGRERIVIASIDSDGSDGASHAAGALVDPQTSQAISRSGYNIRDVVVTHASLGALEAAGDLIVTGPTRTNINDMFVAVVGCLDGE